MDGGYVPVSELDSGLIKQVYLSVRLAVARFFCRIGMPVIIDDVIDISESTLYPILRRLEKNGSLTVYTEEHNYRLRKMYHITPAGVKKIQDYLEDLQELMNIYHYIQKEARQ